MSIWHKFIKNKLAFYALCYVIVVVLVAMFAVPLSLDKSKDANSIQLSIAAKPPLFSATIFSFDKKTESQENGFHKFFFGSSNTNLLVIKEFRLNHAKKEVLLFDDGEGDSSLFYQTKSYESLMLTPTADSIEILKHIEKKHVYQKTFWLGTDAFGRDVLSRMLLGARISLLVGFIAVFISVTLGVLLGALAGYYGNKTDAFIMWLVNTIWSIPTLLLVIAFSMALGKGVWQIFAAVGLSMWVDAARIVRGQIKSIKEQEYVQAARVLGYSDLRILFRHVLPSLIGPVSVIAASNFASAILLEAGLSFLGLGVRPPAPSWGIMIKEHFGHIVLDSAYLAVIPGLAIMFLVMAFNLIGNGFRDAFDVRL